MTSYIIIQKIHSQYGNNLLINLKVELDLPNAKKYFDKVKNSKKKIPMVFSNQILKTQLILIDTGNTNIIQDKDYERKEILEEFELKWGINNDEIQKQKN